MLRAWIILSRRRKLCTSPWRDSKAATCKRKDDRGPCIRFPFDPPRRSSQMPEAGRANIEIAQILGEHKESSSPFGQVALEIVEAVVLAVVAIATAWSGYQAELWTGHQSELYGQASKLRVQAEGAANTANQERLYNASTVVEWLKAE